MRRVGALGLPRRMASSVAMETLRDVVILVHLVGFAVTFGAWATEAAARRFAVTPVMHLGLAISLASGLALAAPWPAGIELDYVKIAVKLALLVLLGGLLGAGGSAQRAQGGAVPAGLFWSIGVVALTAAGVGVLW